MRYSKGISWSRVEIPELCIGIGRVCTVQERCQLYHHRRLLFTMTHCDMLILGGARRRVDLGHILITPMTDVMCLSGFRVAVGLFHSLLLSCSPRPSSRVFRSHPPPLIHIKICMYVCVCVYYSILFWRLDFREGDGIAGRRSTRMLASGYDRPTKATDFTDSNVLSRTHPWSCFRTCISKHLRLFPSRPGRAPLTRGAS